MNKMISFRDLIDLEPKPKKVKYFKEIYNFLPKTRFYMDTINTKYLENIISFPNMNKPLIEIIEEDKPRIEKLKIKQGIGNNNYYLENEEGIKCGMPKHALVMSNKINELCDIINDMEKK